MGQPSSLIKLVETGLQSVDAKNGVQGRYRTAKFLLSLREKVKNCSGQRKPDFASVAGENLFPIS